MKYSAHLFAFLFLATAALAQPSEIVVTLFGDSTVKLYRDENPKRGWGQYLEEYFDGKVLVANKSILGKSSKTYLETPIWAEAKEAKADYWFIQFGHNDSNQGEHRKTDADTTFKENLRVFIESAKKIGAKPVLVTPPPRRRFEKDGRLTTEMMPFVEAMKEVGREDSVPVLDLNARAAKLFVDLGDEASTSLTAPDDRTHFSEEGARKMAGFVVEEIRQNLPDLAAHLKSDSK